MRPRPRPRAPEYLTDKGASFEPTGGTLRVYADAESVYGDPVAFSASVSRGSEDEAYLQGGSGRFPMRLNRVKNVLRAAGFRSVAMVINGKLRKYPL